MQEAAKNANNALAAINKAAADFHEAVNAPNHDFRAAYNAYSHVVGVILTAYYNKERGEIPTLPKLATENRHRVEDVK